MGKKQKEEKEDISLSEVFKVGSEEKGISEFKELIENFFSEDNIQLKTNIKKPLNWSTFSSFIEFFDEKKLPKSIKLLKNFMKHTFILSVCKDGKSREQFVEILKSSGFRMEDESNGRNIEIEDFM